MLELIFRHISRIYYYAVLKRILRQNGSRLPLFVALFSRPQRGRGRGIMMTI